MANDRAGRADIRAVLPIGDGQEMQAVSDSRLAELARFPENNPGPVLWFERSGKVLLANRAARSVLGNDLIGKSIFGTPLRMSVHDWDVVTRSAEVIRREVQIGDSCFSVAYVISDRDNFVFAFASDITDLKEAQAEVAEVARFPDMNPGPVLRISADGHVLLANQAARELFGDSVTGRSWREIYPGSTQRWQDIVVAEQPIYLEGRFNGRDYVFAHRGDRRTDQVFVFGADVSQQKAAERALRQSEKMATLGTLAAGVAHELNNPAAAARRAADQLVDAFARYQLAQAELSGLPPDAARLGKLTAIDTQARERSRLASDLSTVARSDLEADVEDWLDDHNVPDPSGLAPVLVEQGLGTDSLDRLATGFDSAAELGIVVRWAAAVYQVYRLAYEIGQGSARISEIVAALKGYTYLGQPSIAAVDLHEGLDNTLVILRNKLKAGVDVIREYSAELPLVPAYGGELNQVWTNLLDNAVDALNGSGTIIIRTGVDGDDAVVQIEDNGPGIPPDALTRVFDPFFTTKEPGRGTGLGLSTSYSIVAERHHGQMTVESVPGRTCFIVRIPLRAVARPDPDAPATSREAS
jgi:signal transduction histidine kinase